MARHGSLSEQLQALLAYRNRPEGPLEPMGSNWTVVPSNDNASTDEISDLGHERKILTTPSVEEIMRQVETGDVEINESGQTIRIGNLRFSDGTQTEKAYKFGPDNKLVQYDRVMPVGAMLSCREKTDSALGGRGYTGRELVNSNRFYADSFGVDVPRKASRSPRRNGPGYSRDEMQAMLDEAIANTNHMPAVTRCPPGLPAVAERIGDNFNGMKVSVTGGAGSSTWQDISGSIVQREVWDAALAEMRSEDVATLDRALDAKTLADVGMAAGQTRAYADKKSGGRKRLKAANDNLARALKKSAAG
jgi:hypothetical protein